MKVCSIRPRLLPLCAVIVAPFLSTRIGELWQQVTWVPAPAIASIAVAQAAGADATSPGASSPEAAEPASAQAGSQRKGKPAVSGLPTVSTTDPRSQQTSRSGTAKPFSAEEVAALQELAKRRDELDVRGQELDRRDALLRAAEARLDDQVKEMRELQRSIEAALAALDAQQEAKLRGLVKIYEAMKPKDAARIFDKLYRDDAARTMPPLVAVATFHEFAELVPPGATGHQLIRRFAETLTRNNWFDRAAALLQEELAKPPSDEQRGEVETELANIQVRAGLPDAALATLGTGVARGLSAETLLRRQRVRAAALAALGKHAEARVAIAQDSSPPAEAIRLRLDRRGSEEPTVDAVRRATDRSARDRVASWLRAGDRASAGPDGGSRSTASAVRDAELVRLLDGSGTPLKPTRDSVAGAVAEAERLREALRLRSLPSENHTDEPPTGLSERPVTQ